MSKVQLDPEQQVVIDAEGGRWLVLAPPGCGKTETLAHRIRRALERGVRPDDMLCLTFTNRASRGMTERIADINNGQLKIESSGAYDGGGGLFVGNIHRFCAHFLLDDDNAIVHPETSIVDEVDYADILDQLGLTKDAATYRLPRTAPNPYGLPDAATETNRLHHYLQQLQLGQGEEVWLRDCGAALGGYLSLFGIDFAPQMSTEALMSLMSHAGGRDYTDCKKRLLDELKARPSDDDTPWALLYTCILMTALDYARYKTEHRLMDFDDILVLAYQALSAPDSQTRYRHACYHWIQVDEVQDLSAMQLAIVDRLVAPDNATVVYLGDEQQAIFSFLGAKLDSLTMLRSRCEHVVRLGRNHRSPRYLLDVYNAYATRQLGIPADILPSTDNLTPAQRGDLVLRRYAYHSHYTSQGSPYPPATQSASQLESLPNAVHFYLDKGDGGTVAVVVATNHDADEVAHELQTQGIECFRISGQDVFRQMDFKTLVAHLIVALQDANLIEWARLLYKADACRSFTDARRMMCRLRDHALMPSDLMRSDGSTYVGSFCRAYDEEEIVIFDTETTGLDVAHDDIIQIAAITVCHGSVIAGSEFDIILSTDMDIPPTLGDIPNPMVGEYARRPHAERAEGLRRFVDYVGGRAVLGHNVRFDYEILRHNLMRTCPDIDITAAIPNCWDSLRLVRRLKPELKAYKLAALLEALHLEGQNSHCASDDIMATLSLVDYCRREATDIVARQHDVLHSPEVERAAVRLRSVYRPRWLDVQRWLDGSGTERVDLADALGRGHDALVGAGIIRPIDRIAQIVGYVAQTTARRASLGPTSTLRSQLAMLVPDLRTLTEADLCESGVATDSVYVLTVHKAKGLEFDNVIVYDAVDGKYPWYRSTTVDDKREDARKLYVALTRARRRLCIMAAACWVWEGDGPHGHNIVPMSRRLSPFIAPIAEFLLGKSTD